MDSIAIVSRAMHSAFNQFGAFAQGRRRQQGVPRQGTLTIAVLAVGAEKSYGMAMADDLRLVATNVTPAVIPNSGHWIMEQQTAAVDS